MSFVSCCCDLYGIVHHILWSLRILPTLFNNYKLAQWEGCNLDKKIKAQGAPKSAALSTNNTQLDAIRDRDSTKLILYKKFSFNQNLWHLLRIYNFAPIMARLHRRWSLHVVSWESTRLWGVKKWVHGLLFLPMFVVGGMGLNYRTHKYKRLGPFLFVLVEVRLDSLKYLFKS